MMMTSRGATTIDMRRMSRLHMDRMADEDEDPNLRGGIKYPGKHDVMLGRGGESTYHCGNIAFRQLVEDHKTKYYTCPRAHKSRVVAEVVKKWRQLTPPGRFLTRTDPGAGDKSPWHDVGDSRALKKASHSLRDAVRCFSVEKKQRAAEQREMEEGAEFSRDEGATCSVSMPDNRKRLRALGPEFIMSASRVGPNKLGRELEMIASRKQKILVAPAIEERPAKRQRVVCDEREEQQEDCRREGAEDDALLSRRGCEERDCGRDDCDLREAVDSMPSSISWERPAPVGFFSFNSASRASKRQLAPRIPSPCGSAEWFTANTGDLPVQASFALPTADVLVKEVVVENGRTSPADASDDDNSLGWFTDGEHDISSFTAAPLFSVDLGVHRPVAVHSSRRSAGREW